MLFDSVGRALRLFSPLVLVLPKSGGRLRLRLRLGWVIRQELLCGDLFLIVGTDRGLGLAWGLCMNQIPGLHNPYIHNFSITDVPWL